MGANGLGHGRSHLASSATAIQVRPSALGLAACKEAAAAAPASTAKADAAVDSPRRRRTRRVRPAASLAGTLTAMGGLARVAVGLLKAICAGWAVADLLRRPTPNASGDRLGFSISTAMGSSVSHTRLRAPQLGGSSLGRLVV